MAKYTGRFKRIVEYEVEADTPEEAITKLYELVTFNNDGYECYDEEGNIIASSD